VTSIEPKAQYISGDIKFTIGILVIKMPHRSFIVTEKKVLEIGWSVIFVGRIIWKLNQQDQNMCSLPSSRRIHGGLGYRLAIRFWVPGRWRN
jgi:hypothetical protein